MWCSIEELTYNYERPQTVKELNLSSTSHFKIHQIEHLDNFVRLRSLVLSNNMIVEMTGLHNLRNLRVLNLQFNQIRVLEGTQGLANLEELYLSYNEIQIITQSLLCNPKLRILHLAYNDIRSLDNMSVLYQIKQEDSPKNNEQMHTNGIEGNLSNSRYALSELSTLSLYGNPIIATINYLSFFKMLIPSLRIIDDRDANDSMISNSVCPQEQVVILRQAINKLLDERNAAVEELQHYVSAPTAKASYKKPKKESRNYDDQVYEGLHQKAKRSKDQAQLMKYLASSKQKYEATCQNQKQNVSKLTQMYTQNIKKQKYPKQNQYDGDEKEREKSPSAEERPSFNRQIINQLKQQQSIIQQNQAKVKNINNIMSRLEEANRNGQDVCKTILESVLFGLNSNLTLTIHDYFKLCRKYLIKMHTFNKQTSDSTSTGLIQYAQILKSIVFGEHRLQKIQLSQILELQSRIKGKGLLEIITQLKQLNCQENSKLMKFEKQRKSFIKKFQKETEELSISWDELKQEKQKYELQKEKQQAQLKEIFQKKENEMKKKYRIAEQQERQRIIQLKKSRQKSQIQFQKIRATLIQTQQELNRRFIELEQFENHFNQFIQQKEHIKSLQAELGQITFSLQSQQKKFEHLENKVKQLSLEEGIIENKLSKLEQAYRVKIKQVGQLDKKRNETNKLVEKTKQQYDRQGQKLRQVLNTLAIKIEEVKDFDRMYERSKKNLNLMEDKVKNIEQIQSNKKLIIRQLEQEMKCLKQDKQTLVTQLQSMQKNLEGKRQQLIKYQIKIQQNKLAMQTLTDLNKSIGDMMIRQSQLKRSIIQLQIQNRNLMEMKNNILEEFRMKHYV